MPYGLKLGSELTDIQQERLRDRGPGGKQRADQIAGINVPEEHKGPPKITADYRKGSHEFIRWEGL